MTQKPRIFDLLERYKSHFSDKTDALAGKVNGEWIKYSTADYIDISHNFAYGLYELGFRKGDKIATITNNRPEWNFADMGFALSGIIHVPVYASITADEYQYILNHAEVKAVFFGNAAIEKKVLSIDMGDIKTFSLLKGTDKYGFWDIVNLGTTNTEKHKATLENVKNNISADEMATIIYTSGTTGNPKGVMLSHYNLMSNTIGTTKSHDLGKDHKTLSFLPLNHVYERMVNYHFQHKGLSIYYVDNMATLVNDIKEVKPAIFNTVPRLLEKIYDGIVDKGRNLPLISKILFFWAINVGIRFDSEQKFRPYYKAKLALARLLVLNKIKKNLGKQIEIIVSGGASLQIRLERIFGAIGITILQGYGMTETSPVIAVNKHYKGESRMGTVGKIIENVEVQIAQDGEILCKGPNQMIGYYKDSELTKEVIDTEGWLHTGDIGEIDKDGFLKITDRKKEIFKTSSGKYVAPQLIENKLKESFFIEQAMVIGENEKFASSLISPNFTFLHDWCSRHKITYRDNKELVQIPAVIARYQKEVIKVNKQLSDHENIKRFRLVCEEWSPATGEMSPTLKLKRNKITNKYIEIINEIYAADREKENKDTLKNNIKINIPLVGNPLKKEMLKNI